MRLPADTLLWCVLRHDSVAEAFLPGARSVSRRSDGWVTMALPAGYLCRLVPGHECAQGATWH